MADEENKGQQSQDNPNGQETAEKAVEGQNDYSTKITELAKAVGWKEDGPLDAETFLKTMPDRFSAQGRELKEIKHTVQGMAKQFKAATEANYKKGIADTEARMAIARQQQDFDAFEQAQNDKAQLIEANKAGEEALLPEVETFLQENSWFTKDEEMTIDFLAFKDQYLKINPGATPDKVLEFATKKIKKAYPDAFKEEGKKEDPKPPNAVEGAKGGGGGNAKDPIAKIKASLNEDEKRVMGQFVKWGGMTEKEYLEEYAKVREL